MTFYRYFSYEKKMNDFRNSPARTLIEGLNRVIRNLFTWMVCVVCCWMESIYNLALSDVSKKLSVPRETKSLKILLNLQHNKIVMTSVLTESTANTSTFASEEVISTIFRAYLFFKTKQFDRNS